MISKTINHTFNDVPQPPNEVTYDERYQNVCDWCRGTGIHYNQWTSWTNALHKDGRCNVCDGSGVMTCQYYDKWHGHECNGNVHILEGCYCAYHWSEKIERMTRAREAAAPYLSDSPPDWYDYLNAGEYWSEDDY